MPATQASKVTLATAASKVKGLIRGKSKTGDPKCSQAMSDWKSTGNLTHEIAVILARCRNQARKLSGARELSEAKLTERIKNKAKIVRNKEDNIGEFGESKASVTYGKDEYNGRRTKREEVAAFFKRVTGHEYTEAKIASLAGATDDSIVTVTHHPSDTYIEISTKSEKYTSKRRIFGNRIKNDWLGVNKDHQRKGIGTSVFGRQVENAAKLGFRDISTFAGKSETVSGSAGPGAVASIDEMNGYSTWPKLGYDGYLPKYIRESVPGNQEKISDLMTTKEGREWWEKNGTGMDMNFDLSPDSYSMKVFKSYLIERKKRLS